MKILKGGVTKPKGFKANGLNCGIKRAGIFDLGLIVSDCLAVSATVFTKNSVKAAPLIVSQKHARNNKIQAVVVNSGNANCFTGSFGHLYADRTTELISSLLNIPKNDIIVASTGIIGKTLPYKKIQNAAPKLVKGLSTAGSFRIAKSMLTTDTKTKEIAVTIMLDGKRLPLPVARKVLG